MPEGFLLVILKGELIPTDGLAAVAQKMSVAHLDVIKQLVGGQSPAYPDSILPLERGQRQPFGEMPATSITGCM